MSASVRKDVPHRILKSDERKKEGGRNGRRIVDCTCKRNSGVRAGVLTWEGIVGKREKRGERGVDGHME